MSSPIRMSSPIQHENIRGRWFLSFDCATKSFAFALLRVGGSNVEKAAAALRGNNPLAALRDLDRETRDSFLLAGSGAADLVPGKADKKIASVERVRAVLAYLRKNVADALTYAQKTYGCPSANSFDLYVAVEYQMGANAPARTVANVLLTEYASANVFFVGPALKNKVKCPARPDLQHCHFIEKYGSQYTANKKHTKALYFDYIAPLYGHVVDLSVTPSLRKDFADCVMQVLGLLEHGDVQKASLKF
jgi:hypothetical protein